MIRINRLLTILLLVALVFSACQPITRPAPPSAQPVATSEVFAQGALRHSAQGMAFDQAGLLWITDLIGDDISVVNPITGEIVRRFGREAGIYAPADLAIAADGTVYWLQWDTGAVGKIDQAGVVTHLTDVPAGANEIVISPEGRIFVATCNMGDSVIDEVYPTGEQSPRLIHGDLGLCAFRYGDWGPDGFFYGARTDLGEIAHIDVESGELSTVAADLSYPADVKFDHAGHLTTADVTTGEVYRLDPATGQKTVIATLEPGIGALVYDANDHLYVSNEINGSIVEVQPDGAIRSVNPGGIIAPGGLTVVGDTVYLADFLSIRSYDRHTGAQTGLIPKIYGISPLNDPLVVAPDDENLLVTSWLYNSVQLVAPKTGEILATYSDFNTPTNAIRFQGDLLVSELGSGSVVRARGADLAQRETLIQKLKEPIGLAATGENVWVSDSATGTVWQIIAAGQPLAEPKAVATDLAMPEGLALGADGSLLVVEAGAGRLSAINLTTGERQTLATGLQTGLATANAPSFWIFNGVAVDADGNSYVSGDVANVIYRIPAPQLQASLDAATVTKIDTIIQKTMTDYPTPGFTMCIVKDGQVVYSKGFGWADVEHQRPMTPRSVSTEYSIAKSMTAMAVMQLVEQGKVNLDEPVTTYLPYFSMADPRFQAITVRMLLNHTSGMPDDPWDFALTGDADPLEQAVRSLSSKSLLDAPGAAWSYADVGFDILGDLIAKVSGESFPVYMKEHLLKPLGMLTSTFVREEVDSALWVTGYVDGEGGGVTAGEANFDARNAPAANLYSSCEEMAQWAIVMLNQGKAGEKPLLTAESIEAMWTNGIATPWRDIIGPWYGGAFQTYSLGWHLGSMDGHRLVGNAGSGDGFNTQMQLAPDDGLAVIAMNNWLTVDTATWYPASFAAIDVMYTLLGIEPE